MSEMAPLTWTLPDVRHELWGALLLAALFLSLFATAELLRRRVKLPTEVTRKLVHTLSGVVVLVIPHVFTSLYSVVVVGGSFIAFMAVTKVCRLLPSVHQIGRRTTGAVVYPIAIVALLLLTGGRPVLFEVPLLVLACADAAAALVGKAIGRRRYLVCGHVRSLEGSYAFLATSFVIVFAALSIGVAHPADVGTAILVAFVLSLFLTAVEALSTGGWDNLTIPVAGVVGLRSLLHAGPSELVGFLAVAVLFVVGFTGLWLAKRAITVALLRLQHLGGVLVLRLAWFVPLAIFVVAQALIARAVPLARPIGLAVSAPMFSGAPLAESNQ